MTQQNSVSKEPKQKVSELAMELTFYSPSEVVTSTISVSVFDSSQFTSPNKIMQNILICRWKQIRNTMVAKNLQRKFQTMFLTIHSASGAWRS